MCHPLFFVTGAANANPLAALVGNPLPRPRFYIGMWSKHANPDKVRNGNNQLLALTYQRFNIGTLVNSFGKRAYAISLQGSWFSGIFATHLHYDLGYRLGLISGYRGHDLTGLNLLRNSPIIPYAQILIDINAGPVGIEISAPNHKVISVGFYLQF